MSRREPNGNPSGAGHLIDALHAQYFLALDDPRTSIAGDWVAPALSLSLADRDDVLVQQRLSRPGDRREPAPGKESIEALVSGARLMEHAFGPLGGGEAADLIATDPAPEILRLFAPAEYLAAAARRPRALPPALARREHHSSSIDSAMSAPQYTSHAMGGHPPPRSVEGVSSGHVSRGAGAMQVELRQHGGPDDAA